MTMLVFLKAVLWAALMLTTLAVSLLWFVPVVLSLVAAVVRKLRGGYL